MALERQGSDLFVPVRIRGTLEDIDPLKKGPLQGVSKP